MDIWSHLRYFSNFLDALGLTAQAEITTDSRFTLNFATSVKETQEPLNKVELETLRECFTSITLRAIHWLSGSYHIADAFSKDNRNGAAHLFSIIKERTYAQPRDRLTKRATDSCSSLEGKVYHGC